METNFETRAEWFALVTSLVVLAATGVATGVVAMGQSVPTAVVWLLLLVAIAARLPQVIAHKVAGRKRRRPVDQAAPAA
jgi:hypothetical protein